jgi:hypothetical protein
LHGLRQGRLRCGGGGALRVPAGDKERHPGRRFTQGEGKHPLGVGRPRAGGGGGAPASATTSST